MSRPNFISPLAAVRLVFAVNGAAIGVWFPRIPDVKAALDVDLFTLSMCFFMLPVGTMIGFALAQRVISTLGAKRTCATIGPLFVVSILMPAFAPQVALLALALFLVGLTIASIEVAMNMMAGAYEAQTSRRIMTSCHAFWSFGGMAGALVAGLFAEAGISFGQQQLYLTGPLAALAWWFALQLGADPEKTETDSPTGTFTLPPVALLGLCFLPMGALLIEGAVMEWSALFLRGDLELGPFTAARIYAGFAVAMAVARMFGDPLAARFGPTAVIAGSAVLSGIGVLAFATSTGAVGAALAAACLGVGIANIYPLAMSLAAQAPGGSSEANIAAVAFTAFLAFMIGPPFMGTLGSFWGLPTAFLMLTPFALYPLLMTRVPRRLTSTES